MSDMVDVGYPLFVQHNECLKDWTDQCFPHLNISHDSLRCCACVRPCAVAFQVVTYRGSPSFEHGARFSFIAQTLRPVLADCLRDLPHERRADLAEVSPHSGAF